MGEEYMENNKEYFLDGDDWIKDIIKEHEKIWDKRWKSFKRRGLKKKEEKENFKKRRVTAVFLLKL